VGRQMTGIGLALRVYSIELSFDPICSGCDLFRLGAGKPLGRHLSCPDSRDYFLPEQTIPQHCRCVVIFAEHQSAGLQPIVVAGGAILLNKGAHVLIEIGLQRFSPGLSSSGLRTEEEGNNERKRRDNSREPRLLKTCGVSLQLRSDG
jgi:hypothetical protein